MGTQGPAASEDETASEAVRSSQEEGPRSQSPEAGLKCSVAGRAPSEAAGEGPSCLLRLPGAPGVPQPLSLHVAFPPCLL